MKKNVFYQNCCELHPTYLTASFNSRNVITRIRWLTLASFFLFQMASSGIPGVTMDAVSYIQRALMPDLSSAEAAATFSRLIEESLNVISFLICTIYYWWLIFKFKFFRIGSLVGIFWFTMLQFKKVSRHKKTALVGNYCLLFPNPTRKCTPFYKSAFLSVCFLESLRY